jgi:hypothetical protein
MCTCHWPSELAALRGVLDSIVIDAHTDSYSDPADHRSGMFQDYIGSGLEIFSCW